MSTGMSLTHVYAHIPGNSWEHLSALDGPTFCDPRARSLYTQGRSALRGGEPRAFGAHLAPTALEVPSSSGTNPPIQNPGYGHVCQLTSTHLIGAAFGRRGRHEQCSKHVTHPFADGSHQKTHSPRIKALVTTRRTCFCVLSTCKNVGKRRGSVKLRSQPAVRASACCLRAKTWANVGDPHLSKSPSTTSRCTSIAEEIWDVILLTTTNLLHAHKNQPNRNVSSLEHHLAHKQFGN
ncbi:hypothetical protein Bbelb_164900 [Branchiostoma belcheri]|nr:hypothetical protein Bbelb_164900 [Branchiostoma belcheri]